MGLHTTSSGIYGYEGAGSGSHYEWLFYDSEIGCQIYTCDVDQGTPTCDPNCFYKDCGGGIEVHSCG